MNIMKRRILLALSAIVIASSTFAPIASADIYVHGYNRSDGTHVNPYHRSDPDGNANNNWSHSGNTNPYTGQRGYRH